MAVIKQRQGGADNIDDRISLQNLSKLITARTGWLWAWRQGVLPGWKKPLAIGLQFWLQYFLGFAWKMTAGEGPTILELQNISHYPYPVSLTEINKEGGDFYQEQSRFFRKDFHRLRKTLRRTCWSSCKSIP